MRAPDDSPKILRSAGRAVVSGRPTLAFARAPQGAAAAYHPGP